MIKKDIKVSIKKLDNGLLLLNFYDKTTKKFGAEFLTKASSSINPKGKEGLAHLVEHLLARQSKNFPTPIRQSIFLEELGASLRAYTSHFETSYSVNGGVRDARKLLYLLADAILNPHITEESLSAEKSIIEKEIARDLADEGRVAYSQLLKIFTKGSPLVYGNLGTSETLAKINTKDTKEFIKTNYLANNSLVASWGGLKPDKAFELMEKNFLRLKSGEWIEKTLNFEEGKRVVVTKKDSPEVNICIKFRLPKNEDDAELVKVIRQILCSGWTSRIPSRLRLKESLIYSWGGSSTVSHDTANISLSISTANDSYKKVIKIFQDEIKKFIRNPVKKGELEHTKRKLIKPFVWAFETAGGVAEWYVPQYLLNPENVMKPETHIKRMKKITIDDIKNYISKHLTSDNLYISVVGNVNKKDIEFKLN